MNEPVYAQTIHGLRGQLRRLGWDAADLRRMDEAYDVAMRLFTAQFRPTGDPFLAHLVRTASILAAVGAEHVVVIAGLLHSAYTHGEFGDGRRWPSDHKRAEIRTALGSDGERLVYRYADFAWRDVLDALPGSVEALAPEDRAVLLMRLANEVEQWLEVATPDAVGCLRQGAKAARLLGHARLAGTLESVEAGSAGVAIAENGDRPRAGAYYYAGPDASFLLPPRSYRMRGTVVLRNWLRRFAVVRAMRRGIGWMRRNPDSDNSPPTVQSRARGGDAHAAHDRSQDAEAQP